MENETSKYVFTYEELLNLSEMINSIDTENKTVALEILNNCDIKENIESIYLLFKIHFISHNDVKEYEHLKLVYDKYIYYDLSKLGLLAQFIVACNNDSAIRLYNDLLKDFMSQLLHHWKFPVEVMNLKIEFNVK